MHNKWFSHTWLIVLVILISTFSGHLPENVLFPFGNAYLRFAGLFTGWWHDTFATAAGRFLFPGYAYYLGNAVSWLLIAIYAEKSATAHARPVCIFFVGAATNQLLDELVFNPYVFSYNELIVGAFFLYRAWHEYREVKRANP